MGSLLIHGLFNRLQKELEDAGHKTFAEEVDELHHSFTDMEEAMKKVRQEGSVK